MYLFVLERYHVKGAELIFSKKYWAKTPVGSMNLKSILGIFKQFFLEFCQLLCVFFLVTKVRVQTFLLGFHFV